MDNISVTFGEKQEINIGLNIGGEELHTEVEFGTGGVGCEIDTTELASKDLEKFFGLPAALPEGYEFMTSEEVCSELEEIMTSMDINLTPEKAKEITNNTLNKE